MAKRESLAGDAVRVEGLSKTFNPGTVRSNRVLADVSFELAPGDFAVVIGSNGAGKSTLLNALAGEVRVDAGTISIGSTSLQALPAHRRAKYISRVFQDPMLGTAAALTIEENLAIAMRRGMGRRFATSVRAADRDLFRERLAALGLGLEQRLAESVELLSGGQRQSLTLVMATLKAPNLLLLDEHTAALDPRAAELVMAATIQSVEGERLTTLMVTHNMEHAVSHGNRLIMMHEGRIILNVTGEEKSKLTVSSLVDRFHAVVTDRMLLN